MKILICDDNAVDRELIRRVLLKRYAASDIVEVENCNDAKVMAKEVDLVLMDQKLVGEQGVDCLRSIRGDGFRGGFILLTGWSDDTVALLAMQHGADDFILKDTMKKLLIPAIEKAMEHRKESIETTANAEKQLQVLDKVHAKLGLMEDQLQQEKDLNG